MPTVHFHHGNGRITSIEVEAGTSVMRAARDNDVAGIDADCGGVCACATCHVYVDAEWTGRVGAAGDDESEMLDCANDPKSNSRLSCQVAMSAKLDGLVVYLPESQR